MALYNRRLVWPKGAGEGIGVGGGREGSEAATDNEEVEDGVTVHSSQYESGHLWLPPAVSNRV